MKYLWRISLLLVFLNGTVSGQNKYFPPDPYSLGQDKQHFSRYLITSPAYMGPNALPVPRLMPATLIDQVTVDLAYEQYRASGDQTHDLAVRLGFPVARGRASFLFHYIPYEFYQTDSVTSRLRRTESGSGLNGTAHGDVYFGARARLIGHHPWLPDMAFGMFARTASGTAVEDARYTDTPGYYLDLTLGKQYQRNTDLPGFFRWYAVIGFYVWQTYLDDYPQNDALLYGAGFELRRRRWGMTHSLRGYNGYMNNGDHPLVYRTELQVHEGPLAVVFGYERGLRDYPFSGYRIGLRMSGFKEVAENE